MRNYIIFTALALSALIILGQSGVLMMVVAFVLVGAVPGTAYSVPPSIMSLAYALVALVVLWRAFGRELPPMPRRQPKSPTRYQQHKQRTPRRRYARIYASSAS